MKTRKTIQDLQNWYSPRGSFEIKNSVSFIGIKPERRVEYATYTSVLDAVPGTTFTVTLDTTWYTYDTGTGTLTPSR